VNVSAAFICRPIATTLLTFGVALGGAVAFFRLPVAPLPRVDYPVITVQAQLPGASPEVMSTSVATPLERHLGQIADVNEMTSSSSVGTTRITLQFGLDRDINGAARDVQAAINAARVDLPANLRSNPTYRKVNPADAPIMILALTSETLDRGQIYDSASTVLEQRISQVEGVGQVTLSGSSLPAVRVELNPQALFQYQIGLESVRAAISAANAHAPKGAIEEGDRHYQIYTNDQARTAGEYRSLIIAYRNGAAVRLSDVADVVDSVENLRNDGIANGKPAVLVQINREPGANIIETVDRVRELLPQLRASIPSNIDVDVAVDRSTTIRTSLRDVERTLIIAVFLVIGVVFLFLRNVRAALIPSVAVPVSLLGTFGFMYLLGFSLDNLSLMALTIATGFVVDDAIVVVENVTRHIESGMSRVQAALRGAREVGFTVLSMSLSLIAVFIPILLMGGIIGRMFREFAISLSIAILVSLAVSLTTTPMMCAILLHEESEPRPGSFHARSERAFAWVVERYGRSLAWALGHPRLILAALVAALALSVYLFTVIPKGFFPTQDTGRIVGSIFGDQSISFQAMREKLDRFVDIVQKDPAVESVAGFTGGGSTNSGFIFLSLKPIAQRHENIDQTLARLRRDVAVVPGANMFFQAVQDVRVGGRQSSSTYQYTLQADSTSDIYEWSPKIAAALQALPELVGVDSDQQQGGLQMDVKIDRETAARLGISTSQITNVLYDAFGQRQVSTIYNPLNQYHVVMEVAPQYWQNPDTLKQLYVSTSGGALSGTQATGAVVSSGTSTTAAQDAVRNARTNAIASTGKGGSSTGAAISTSPETMIPLAAFTSYGPGTTPLSVRHQGPFVATTISFDLAPGVSLSQAVEAINQAMNRLGVPTTIHGSFQGTARAFQQSLSSQPFLILAALIAVYVVLGILYESVVHPITILSTLPSAGVGAVLALMAARMDFTIIALIGVILLIGIVKKNAIMMIDFALDAERAEGLSSRDAIYKASLLRLRPILMTTMAALFGAVPLILSFGEGSELRHPLGVAIIGGLLVSQVLTLYTTPVIYLYLDRFRLRARDTWRREHPGLAPAE
jgi:multidrug efflux pump